MIENYKIKKKFKKTNYDFCLGYLKLSSKF